MKFGFVTVVRGRQWFCNVDATSNGGMIIPESFDGSSGKPKKINAVKKHRGRQRLFLIHYKDRKSWPQEGGFDTMLEILNNLYCTSPIIEYT